MYQFDKDLIEMLDDEVGYVLFQFDPYHQFSLHVDENGIYKYVSMIDDWGNSRTYSDAYKDCKDSYMLRHLTQEKLEQCAIMMVVFSMLGLPLM